MMIDTAQLGLTASWVATAVGAGLWLWSWFGVRDRLRKLRFYDCGMVLVFAAILLRVAMQGPPFGPLDWLFIVAGPVFIAAALWRLSRTGPAENGSH